MVDLRMMFAVGGVVAYAIDQYNVYRLGFS